MPLRKREEVQEMPRSVKRAALIATFLLIGAAARAAIFPDQIGPYQKSAP